MASSVIAQKHRLGGNAGLAVRAFRGLLMLASFLIITVFVLFLNIIQLLTVPFFYLWPDEAQVFRWHTYLALPPWRLIYLLVTRVGGFQVSYSGLEGIPAEENAYVISNHSGFMDLIPILGFSWEKNMMHYLKFFMKDSLKYFPIYGWAMYLMGMTPLKRNWNKDQHTFEKALDLYRNGKLPVYLVSFPEGSRVAPDKLQRSRIYAKEQGLPVLDYLLLPRSKGFIATIKGLRGSKVKCIYDVTLSYYNETRGFSLSPDFRELLMGSLGSCHCHVHVERILIDSLPVEEAELSKWLFDRFELKDKRLAEAKEMYKTLI